MYALAILLPPLPFLVLGKPFQFLFNIFLLACGIVPGLIHALLVVHSSETKKNMVAAIKEAKAS